MTQPETPPIPAPMTLAWFESGLESTFDVTSYTVEGPVLALRLVEVRKLSAPPGWEQFSAFFHGPVSPLAMQGTYRFTHSVLGEIGLFMMPVGREAEAIHYEVCVTRDTRTGSK